VSAGSTRVGVREKWNLELTLNHAGRKAWDHTERLIVLKKRGESAEHVAMKVLAYLLLYQDGLAIEASADQHYKPDVVLLDDQGQPRIWADCGTTSVKKLDKISAKNRLTLITIIKTHVTELKSYKKAAASSLRRPEQVRWWSFQDHFVTDLAQRLRGRHTIEASVSPEPEDPDLPSHIYLIVDGEPIDSPVLRLE